MLNFNVLDAALDAIEAEPHRWNQGSWIRPTNYDSPSVEACGTQMCLAGHIANNDPDFVIALRHFEEDYLKPSPELFSLSRGKWLTEFSGYDIFAAEALGLDPNEDASLICNLFLNNTHLNGDWYSPADFRRDVYKTIARHYVTLAEASKPPPHVNDDPWTSTEEDEDPPF